MTAPRSGLPYRVAVTLIKAADDGGDDLALEFDELKARLPDASDDDLRKAIWTLRQDGYVEVRDMVNAEYVRITQRLYEFLDQVIMGWITKDDGRHLAKLVRADEGANAQELHKKTGWPLRRFNPAMKWLVNRLPRKYVTSPVNPHYRFFYILGEPPVLFQLDQIIKSSRSN